MSRLECFALLISGSSKKAFGSGGTVASALALTVQKGCSFEAKKMVELPSQERGLPVLPWPSLVLKG